MTGNQASVCLGGLVGWRPATRRAEELVDVVVFFDTVQSPTRQWLISTFANCHLFQVTHNVIKFVMRKSCACEAEKGNKHV